ncbi:ABC transporter substrate-binding protein [Streptomyces sp. SP17BM10]|uniref:ABC transporter substrate-binding protein n=1 Tax=Streptomyces sp. SP17BM10 TaxID=3002530 RepID=UPI002E7AA910|nr:ABC transporter substrate-binding protein [Streptomyces sp. SP17BM10]MEE1782131.1 ABC transporter substrate-binding protein [Streptomyces sp. SP17BM10]
MSRPLRRALAAVVLTPALIAALTSCGSSASSSPARTLRVGDQKGGASQALLDASGQSKSLPYHISWSSFSSGPPMVEAIGAGSVDIGAVGNTPPVFAGSAHRPVKVVGALRSSEAGDAVLVPKGSALTDVAALKGRTIAVAQGSSAHNTLVALLLKAGLGPADVHLSYLQPADALAAFTAGKVDAWAVWDPYTAIAEQAGGHILATGEPVSAGLAFTVASDGALADPARSELVGDYLRRVRAAWRWAATHQEQWAQVWAKEAGIPYEVALVSVRRTQSTSFGVALDDDAVRSEQRIVDTFAAQKLIPSSFTFADFTDRRFNADLPPSATTTAPAN